LDCADALEATTLFPFTGEIGNGTVFNARIPQAQVGQSQLAGFDNILVLWKRPTNQGQ
jgi:hypothetical protein